MVDKPTKLLDLGIKVDLESGQTVTAHITKSLRYEVTHEGWTFKVACVGGQLRITPNPDGSVSICCVGADNDEFG